MHLLVGKMMGESGRAHTWFQAERSPWRAPEGSRVGQVLYAAGNMHSLLKHGMDYIRHRLTGKQVGPLGLSKHHDGRPTRVHCSTSPP